MPMRLRPSYRPIYQLPYCCVPATLQWIFYRRGLDILDQADIGAELGLRLPPKGKTMFKNRKIAFVEREPKGGYGTQIEKKKFSIQKFFDRQGIALKISGLFEVANVAGLKSLLASNLEQGNDVILRYHTGLFKKTGQKGYGHFSVIAGFDPKAGTVIVGDPEPPHFKRLSVRDVVRATSAENDGVRRGLYVISSKRKT